MLLVFLPSVLIFVLSFFKVNRVLMSIIAASIILPVIYILNNPFHNTFFYVDKLGGFVLLVSSIVGIGVSLSLISLPKRVKIKNEDMNLFYRFFGVFWLGLIVSILANNMGLYWIGLEFATLSTVYMIKTKRTIASNNEAWKYLIVGAVAISFILFGIILMYASAKGKLGEDAMNFYILMKNVNDINPFLFEIGFLIASVGMFVKMGFFPMNLWLADIERAAVYPVGALFSGILESAIILGFFRFSKIEYVINYSHLITFVYAYAIFTLFMVSFLLFRSKDYVRMFSLSGIEHMTLISLFWVSGGFFAALLHFAAHAFFKPALFLSSGMLEQNGKYVFKGTLKGYKNKSVVILISVLLLGIISLPPSPMFFSEIFGFKAMIDISKNSPYFLWMISAVFLILIFLSVIFYKFVQVYQEALYEGEEKEKKVYVSEILMLILFSVSLFALLFSFNYIKGIAQ